jgi:hypothetical protein
MTPAFRVARFVPLVALGFTAVALAAPGNFTVEGRLDLPPGGVKEPEAQYVGFIPRIANAITELRPYDPRPECFVFLEGGPAGPDAAVAPAKPISWLLYASNFATPLVPVVAGTTVEIKNISQTTHPLFAVDKADALGDTSPVGPGGVRSVKVSEVGKSLLIRSKDSPHLEARLVALPSKYFSRLKKDGSFAIEDVPPGKWTAKVWCKDGFLPVMKNVDVAGRNARVDLVLPDRIEPVAKPANP